MEYFKFDDLSKWYRIDIDEKLVFEGGRYRRLKISFMASGPVEIWASNDPEFDGDAWLVASGSGAMQTEFALSGDVYLMARTSEKDVTVFMDGIIPDHRVAPPLEPSYTTIAPRPARNAEMDKIAGLLRYNEERRQAEHRQAMQRLEALEQRASAKPAVQLIEAQTEAGPEAQTEAKPEPKPEAKTEVKPVADTESKPEGGGDDV